MEVSLNTLQKGSQLFEKTFGITVRGGTKLKCANRLSIHAPMNAETFDFISGIGQKGKFQRYAFRNADGQVVQSYTRYITDNGGVRDVITDFERIEDCIFNTTRRTVNHGFISGEGKFSSRGHLEQTEYSSMIRQINPHNNEQMFSRNFLTLTPHGDFAGIELLQQGCKPVGINYKFDWKGVPQIEYKNALGKTLDLTETEAMRLPFLTRKYAIIEQNGVPTVATIDFIPTGRMQEKIGLAQKIQEKEHNIEGIAYKVKGVKQKNLPMYKDNRITPEEFAAKNNDLCFYGLYNFGGQIYMAIDIPRYQDGLMVSTAIAHEIQHLVDDITKYRGNKEALMEALQKYPEKLKEYINSSSNDVDKKKQTFIKRVFRKKGLALRGSKEYNEAVRLWDMEYAQGDPIKMTSLAQHNAGGLEVRAIHAEEKELAKIKETAIKVGTFNSGFIKIS